MKPKLKDPSALNQASKSSSGTNQVFQIGNQIGNPLQSAKIGQNNARPYTQQINTPVSLIQNPSGPYPHISLFIHKIIGSTSSSENSFVIINSNICVYLAQSFIVFFDFINDKQLLHYSNPNSKPYKSLAFVEETNMLYVGEGNTKQGEIQLFQISFNNESVDLEQTIVLRGHKYGIRQIKVFGDLVVSIGDDNDKGILVWETISPRLISANLSKKSIINGVQFLGQKQDTIEFITYGSNNHLKVWNIKIEQDQFMKQYTVNGISEIKQGQTIPKLVGNKIIMKECPQDTEFSNLILEDEQLYLMGFVKSSEHKAYRIYKYNMKKNVVEQQLKQPLSSSAQMMINLNKQTLLITGSFKRLQLLNKDTLKFQVGDFAWAQPPSKGQLQMITQEIYDYLVSTSANSNSEFAEIDGIIFQKGIIVQIMTDGMILMHDYEEQKLLRAIIQHSDSIHDLVIKEYQANEDFFSFFTCSKDNTLRVWNTYIGDSEIFSMMGGDMKKPVEGDLKRILYLEQKDEFGEAQRISSADDEIGIKCMAYNQMRNQLAVGDMVGNIRIYQMSPDNHKHLQQVNFIEAHEGKVVALQYSEPYQMNNSDSYVQFLVSASSDRMIHIFNASSDDYDLLQTIDAHTTSIIDVKFTKCTIVFKNKHKITQYEKQLRLYTCSTDKTMLCHRFNPLDQKFQTLQPKDLHRNKIYKMALTDSQVVLAKDQGIIEIKSIETGKVVQTFQQTAQHQTLSKNMLDYTYATVSMDNLLLALNDKEKSIQIREIRQCSNLLAKYGLADTLSAIQFTSDNKFLICSSVTSKEQGGGLIYLFKVEHESANIKKLQGLIQKQRNENKVVVVDQSSSGVIDKNNFDQMLNNLPQQRKFTVKDELFNTWAKSTNQQSKNEKNDGDDTPNQMNQINEDEEFLPKAKQQQNMRKSSFSPPNKGQKTAWQRVQQEQQQQQFQLQPLQQPELKQESSRKCIDEFINELDQDEGNELKVLEGDDNNSQDSATIKIEEIADDELHKKVEQNLAIESINNRSRTNQMGLNTSSSFSLRNSLTFRFLNEQATQRESQNNSTEIVRIDGKEQHDDKIQSQSLSKATTQKEVELDQKERKEKKTLFNKLFKKFEKIESIIMEQEEIDPTELRMKERLELSVKINKTIQQLTQLQVKFIDFNKDVQNNMLSKLGGFVVGGAIGAGFICTMDDVIYGQLRRNIILPTRKLFYPQEVNPNQGIVSLTKGTNNFVQQFKPQNLGRTNVKALLMNDSEYSTPQDHYFSYLNSKKSDDDSQKKAKDIEILKNLGLETVLHPAYDINSGSFVKKVENIYLNEDGQPIKEEDMDIFELAKLRGQKVKHLEELISNYKTSEINQPENRSQKHKKSEYDQLKRMGVSEIIASSQGKIVEKPFEDDGIMNDMVKIEKKRNVEKKKQSKKEQRQRSKEISKMLQNPQDINYEKAMQLYDEQALEAKNITEKDKRRLRRLKKKAEALEKLQEEQQQAKNEPTSNIKLAEKTGVSEDSDDVDSLVK